MLPEVRKPQALTAKSKSLHLSLIDTFALYLITKTVGSMGKHQRPRHRVHATKEGRTNRRDAQDGDGGQDARDVRVC